MLDTNPKNPFFNADDFKSLDMTIEGTNQTSQMKITGIQLVQILSNGIWVDIPPKCCSMGHSIALDLCARWTKDGAPVERKLHILSVIEEMEGLPGGRQQVKLRFRQYGMAEWEDLLGYYSGKQTNLNQLIQNTRK